MFFTDFFMILREVNAFIAFLKWSSVYECNSIPATDGNSTMHSIYHEIEMYEASTGNGMFIVSTLVQIAIEYCALKEWDTYYFSAWLRFV